MNAYVVHRDEGVFGTDPDAFMPERWLRQDGESRDVHERRITRMKEADLTFGHGSRVCSGRSVALLEMYKAIASLFAKYDVELVHPEKEWTLTNKWFNRQSNMDCWIKPRV